MIPSMDAVAANPPSGYISFSPPNNSTPNIYQSLTALPRPRAQTFSPATLPLVTGQVRNGRYVHCHRKRGRPRKYLMHHVIDDVDDHRNGYHFHPFRNVHLDSFNVPEDSVISNLQYSRNVHFEEPRRNHFQEAKNGNFQECRNNHFQVSRDDEESRNNDRKEAKEHHFQESRTNEIQKRRENHFQESTKSHLHRTPFVKGIADVSQSTEQHTPRCCFISNQGIPENKLAYSEIIDFSSRKSWPAIEMRRNDVNGCLECYYGNAAHYSHKHCHLESGRCSGGVTLANQNGAFCLPYYPAKVPPHVLNDVINDAKYGSHVEPGCVGTQPKIDNSESVPVIIECFSLSNKRGHFKTTHESPFSLATRHCPNKEVPEIEGDKLCDDHFKRCEQNIKKTELDEADSTANYRNSYCVQPGFRGFPTVPIVVDMSSTTSPDNCFKSTTSPHKPQHTPTKEHGRTESNIDVYEVYHSKYYKKGGHLRSSEGEKQQFEAQEETMIEVEELPENQQKIGLYDEERSEKLGKKQHEKNNQKYDYYTSQGGKVHPKIEIDGGAFFKKYNLQLSQNELGFDDAIEDPFQNDAYSPKSPAISIDESQEKSLENYKERVFQEQCQSNSKSYVCIHCSREFTHLSSLNNHVRTHTGHKPFKCQFCGKRFAQSGVLTAHLRTHTGDRPFECIICKKRFAQTTTLANHIRTHTGQKPFNCKYCKRKFAQSSTRNKHELSHTKEKPYVCKYCRRSFAQSATVTRHMRIHMRQEAFTCVYCGREFPYLHALDKHLDSHDRASTQLDK